MKDILWLAYTHIALLFVYTVALDWVGLHNGPDKVRRVLYVCRYVFVLAAMLIFGIGLWAW